MSEDIYGLSVSYFQGKIVRHKVHNVEPIIVTSFPKCILDRYNKVTIFYDLMHINGIVFLNTISDTLCLTHKI